MPGDNFKVEVRSRDKSHFEMAVRMAFANAPGGEATHFVSPIPATQCRKCCGRGIIGHWKDMDRKVYCEFKCQECDEGQSPSRAGMVLLWHEDSIGGVPAAVLPFPLNADAAVGFLGDYLSTADYGPEPDHDGSNGKGFIVTTGDFWGHVHGSHYAFIGVYPDWQMYGK